MTSPALQGQNEDVQVVLHKKEECRVELEVKATGQVVSKARKQAIKVLAKDLAVPGFRKGKAPEELLLKKYPQAFEEEWKKAIADVSFIAAQKAIHIPPLTPQGNIRFNVKNYSSQEGAEITFTYEAEPEIPSVDTSSFTLASIKRPEVGEREIEEALRQTRFFYAQWKEVQDRPLKEGDYVILDLDSLEGETPTNVFAKTRFEVSDKGMAKWMKKALLGAKCHDVVEAVSSPDEDLPAEEKKAFEPKKVRITIQKIEEASLPELNDEFAQKMGLKTVDELRAWVTAHLNKQADEKVASEKHHQVCHFLLKQGTFTLPPSLIASEKNFRLKQALENPRFKDQWEKMSKQEKEQTEKNITQEAIDAIKLFYLSRKVIEDAKIAISQEEVVQEASQLYSERYGKAAHPQDIEKDLFALAFSRLILSKAEEFLLGQTTSK